MTLMGAVQRGASRAVTYFYLGNAEIDMSRIQKLCDLALNDKTVQLTEESMLCTALEMTDVKAQSCRIVGFAFRNASGRIVILSVENFYKEYIGEFAKEAIVYYESGQ